MKERKKQLRFRVSSNIRLQTAKIDSTFESSMIPKSPPDLKESKRRTPALDQQARCKALPWTAGRIELLEEEGWHAGGGSTSTEAALGNDGERKTIFADLKAGLR